MQNLNLVLTFRLAGQKGVHVKGATRIKVDGSGLQIYGAEDAAAEQIEIDNLSFFSIQPVMGLRQATAAHLVA
jgi:hypothetical protein